MKGGKAHGREKENQFIDADRFLDVYEEKIEDYKPNPEILEEFVDAAKQTSGRPTNYERNAGTSLHVSQTLRGRH